MKKRRIKSFIRNMDMLHMFVETLTNLYEYEEKEDYLINLFDKKPFLLEFVPLSFDEWECCVYYGKEILVHWYDNSYDDYVKLSSKPVIFDKLQRCKTNKIENNLIKSYDYIYRHVIKFLKTLTEKEIEFINKIKCENYCEVPFELDHIFNSHNNDGKNTMKDFFNNFDKMRNEITRV